MEDETIRIDQKRFLRGSQTLILGEKMLKVECRRVLSLNEYRFDLGGFLPDPLRVKRVPAVRIVASGLLTFVGVILLIVAISGKLKGDDIASAILVGTILLILAALIWITAAKDMVNVLLFQGPGGQFVLWPDHPDKEEFKGFLTTVSSRIREARHPEQNVVSQLRRAGIIDDWQYEQAIELLEQKR